jgi:hypothetical protein
LQCHGIFIAIEIEIELDVALMHWCIYIFERFNFARSNFEMHRDRDLEQIGKAQKSTKNQIQHQYIYTMKKQIQQR